MSATRASGARASSAGRVDDATPWPRWLGCCLGVSAAMLEDLPIPAADAARHDMCLLARIRACEGEAIGELYDRHHRLLFGLILRIVRNEAEAEEVLQDVFLQVWKRAETYKAELGTPVQWLVRIARNRAIDRIRSNGVRTRVLEAAPPPPPVERPDRHAVLSQQQRALVRALDGLRAEERQLLEHAYFLGLTQSELATHFNLPLGTVKTRIRTALTTLRRELQRSMVEDRQCYQV